MEGSGPGFPTSSDREHVERLLGRPSLTSYTIAVRCPHGGPAVLQNEPLDADGRPFPTRYWLACRAISTAVSRLEASGGVGLLERDDSMREELHQAHARHAERHAGYRVGGIGDHDRVKCLHAHLAFALAEGGTPIGEWIWEHANAGWPDRCCAESDVEETS